MNRATETEQGLPADAQVLLEVVHQVILLAEGEQGDVGGVPHGHQRDDLAETQPQEVHGDPGCAPQPGQDGGRGEGRDVAPQVSNYQAGRLLGQELWFSILKYCVRRSSLLFSVPLYVLNLMALLCIPTRRLLPK